MIFYLIVTDYIPQQMNMEPENHPFGKENDIFQTFILELPFLWADQPQANNHHHPQSVFAPSSVKHMVFKFPVEKYG